MTLLEYTALGKFQIAVISIHDDDEKKNRDDILILKY